MTNLALVSMDDLKVFMSVHAIKNEVWEVAEAAKFLKVHPKTLKKQAELGKVPGEKIGRDWKFSSIALFELVSKKELIK